VTLTTTSCPCGRGLPRGHTICPACAGHLVGILHAVPELLRELDVTIARQGSVHEGAGGDDLVLDLVASAARAYLVSVLTDYGRRWLRTHLPVQGDRARAMCLLLSRPARLAVLLSSVSLDSETWADDLHRALADAERASMVAVDRPPDRRFVGWCPGSDCSPCGAALYAVAGQALTRCTRCGAMWDVETSRAALLVTAEDVVADGSTLARACEVPLSTMRSWRRRGKLVQATDPEGRPACDDRGRPLYRLSDVRRLVLGG